jgi:hypothetical protein
MQQSEGCVVHRTVVYKRKNVARTVAVQQSFVEIKPFYATYSLSNHGWRNGRQGPTTRPQLSTTSVRVIFAEQEQREKCLSNENLNPPQKSRGTFSTVPLYLPSFKNALFWVITKLVVAKAWNHAALSLCLRDRRLCPNTAVCVEIALHGLTSKWRKLWSKLIFRLLCTNLCIQYNETNVIRLSLNLLIIKGLYIFQALLSQPQEAQHKRHLVHSVRTNWHYTHAIYQMPFVLHLLRMCK